jgi:hypothetical protein
MTEEIVSKALHDWEDTLAKVDGAKEALLDFLHGADDKQPGYQGLFCIVHTLELVGVEGHRAFDIVNKAKAGETRP